MVRNLIDVGDLKVILLGTLLFLLFFLTLFNRKTFWYIEKKKEPNTRNVIKWILFIFTGTKHGYPIM